MGTLVFLPDLQIPIGLFSQIFIFHRLARLYARLTLGLRGTLRVGSKIKTDGSDRTPTDRQAVFLINLESERPNSGFYRARNDSRGPGMNALNSGPSANTQFLEPPKGRRNQGSFSKKKRLKGSPRPHCLCIVSRGKMLENGEQKLNMEEKLALALHRNLLILLGNIRSGKI